MTGGHTWRWLNNRASKARTKNKVFLDSNSRLFARKSEKFNGNICLRRLSAPQAKNFSVFNHLKLKAFSRQFFLTIPWRGDAPLTPPPSYATVLIGPVCGRRPYRLSKPRNTSIGESNITSRRKLKNLNRLKTKRENENPFENDNSVCGSLLFFL